MRRQQRRVILLIIIIFILFLCLPGCSRKDQTNTTTDTQTTSVLADITNKPTTVVTGDIIRFGSYEQDNNTTNGNEPIEWRVLTVIDGKVLLLSEKILDKKPFEETKQVANWETCSLRRWLNSVFLNSAFSVDEQSDIIETTISTVDDALQNSFHTGKDTQDKVFLLSYSEAINSAFGFSSNALEKDTARRAEGTKYAIENGLYEYYHFGLWWLRTSGKTQVSAANVHNDGSVHEEGYVVTRSNFGVRPAIWISSVTATAAKDESTQVTTPITETNKNPGPPQTSTKAGDVVVFGKYEQDNNFSNGMEAFIEWRVLAVENGKALLLSEKILDCKPYNDKNNNVTWEICTLRKWLNDEFYNTSFNADEKVKIQTTQLVNKDNPKHGTSGGNDTNDKVFLLSIADVLNPGYGFSADESAEDPARRALVTDFAESNGVFVVHDYYISGCGSWWLRSPGDNQNGACSVFRNGDILHYSSSLDVPSLGVRPAVWIKL